MKRINLMTLMVTLLLYAQGAWAQNEFITTWETTSAGESITIPTTGTGYNYQVDWGDGNVDPGLTGDAMHTYAAAGIHTVTITGDFPRIYFNNGGDKDKILSVEQWGNIAWTSMSHAFEGCSKLRIPATDAPNLTNVTSLDFMLKGCVVFNDPINHWSVSTIENLSNTFFQAESFNQDLNNWDISNVYTLFQTFGRCTNFNGDITNWNTTNVENLFGTFAFAESFNQDISGWDVSSVTTLYVTFREAYSFDQPIGSWDVSNVTQMIGTFWDATSFNQPLDSWTISNVTQINQLFKGASSFNQDLNSWDLNGITDLTEMFYDATVFNGDISSWDVSTVTNMKRMFRAASNFNQDISGWDVSQVTDFGQMLFGVTNFNQDISGWNVSAATDMSYMLYGLKDFNVDISGWDVSNVLNMSFMLGATSNFNQDISSWNVLQATNMSFMFYNAEAFNQPLNNWNVSNVENMRYMFRGAVNFNQNISVWDVSSVTDMSHMFTDASKFNQNLENWDVSNVADMTNMFLSAGMSGYNYDNLLKGWSTLTLQSDVSFYISAPYCHGSAGKEVLENTYNWEITDQAVSCTPFISTWQTTDGQITIPTTGTGYNYDITWTNLTNAGVGDGSASAQVGDHVITDLANGDTYQIEISGDFPRIYFNNAGDKDKILTVEQWGTTEWASMENAFYGCNNLTITATDAPNLTKVISLESMFRSCNSLNSSLDHWNTGNITNMSNVFLFSSSFDQDLNNWDVGKVTTMRQMFTGASAFNGNISDWDVSSVTSMSGMFYNANNFNQDISDWDMSSVSTISRMFRDAVAFNQDISKWNTANVTNTDFAFSGALSFDRDLSNWNVEAVADMTAMFDNCGMSTLNYDNTLIGWAAQSVQTGVTLGAASISYCQAGSARTTLQGFWTINDGGQNCVLDFPDVNFENALLALPSVNTTDDGVITIQEALALTNFLDVRNQNISDLSGVENFRNITQLLVDDNQLTSLDISELTELMTLFVKNNSITDLNTSKNQKLKTIEAGNNQIASVDFSQNPELETVQIAENNLTSLDLSNNPNLWRITAFYNEITEIDLSGNLLLESVNFEFNQLTEIDVSMLPLLTTFKVRGNDLTSVNLKNGANTNLSNSTLLDQNPDLYCVQVDDPEYSRANWNFVDSQTDFSTDCGQWTIDQGREVFDYLSKDMISNQTFSGSILTGTNDGPVDFTDGSVLIYQTSAGRYGKMLVKGFDENANLNIIFDWITYNEDGSEYSSGSLNATGNIDLDDGLTGLGGSDPKGDFRWTRNTSTRSSLIPGNATFAVFDDLVVFNDADLPAAILSNYSSVDRNSDGLISVNEAVDLEGEIDLTSNGSIDDGTGLDAFINLTSLKLGSNNISAIKLNPLDKLTTFWAPENNISSLDLSGNTELTSVILNNNPLGAIDLTSNVNIQTLQLNDCSLTNGVDISTLTDLRSFSARSNSLSSIDLSQNGELTNLRLETNNLSSVSLGANTQITQLRLSGNQLSSVDLSGLSALTTLYIDNNPITELDVSGNTAAHTISSKNGSLSSLNIANGNNANFVSFDVLNNHDLTCITVDNVAYAETNFTNVDDVANFSTNCSNLETDISAFSFTEETGAATINSTNHTIDIEVAFGTDLSSLIPAISTSAGSAISPESGVAQDFSGDFTYAVTAENPTVTQEWVVSVSEANVAPTDIALSSNSIDENEAADTEVGLFSSTDGNQSDTHTYSLVAGTGDTDNASFTISENVLTANESFDFETKSSYSIRVSSDDGRGGTFEKVFTISVNDLSGAVQTVTINAVTDKKVNDPNFEVSATTTSGLTIDYTISGVATISGTTVTLTGSAGKVEVIASQAGDEDYASDADTVVFNVSKLSQQISFRVIEGLTYGDADTVLSASSDANLEVTYLSSDPAIAAVSGDTLKILGAGSVDIMAFQPGDETYSAADTVAVNITISKAPLRIAVANANKLYGEVNPEFTLEYGGFVGGDAAKVLDELPEISTSATGVSSVGVYAVTLAGGIDKNYNFELNDGELTVEKASLTIGVESASREYGEENPSFSLSFSGFVLDEDSSVIDELPTASAAATASSSTGVYQIVLKGGSDNNYELVLSEGELTVVKATLNVLPDSFERVYGESNPTFTFSYSGFRNSDDASAIDTPPTLTVPADRSSDAGRYSIIAEGGIDDNYQFTYEDGLLTVTKAIITATPQDAEIDQGESLPTIAINYSGFVNNDDASAIDSEPIVLLPVEDSSTPGTYTIELEGGLDNNYSFEYETGTLTINEVEETALSALEKPEVEIYPNPVVEVLNIRSSGKITVSLFDLEGKMLYTRKGEEIRIEMTNYRSGTYILILNNDNGEMTTSKIIKK